MQAWRSSFLGSNSLSWETRACVCKTVDSRRTDFLFCAAALPAHHFRHFFPSMRSPDVYARNASTYATNLHFPHTRGCWHEIGQSLCSASSLPHRPHPSLTVHTPSPRNAKAAGEQPAVAGWQSTAAGRDPRPAAGILGEREQGARCALWPRAAGAAGRRTLCGPRCADGHSLLLWTKLPVFVPGGIKQREPRATAVLEADSGQLQLRHPMPGWT
jgi:hypothetical protein